MEGKGVVVFQRRSRFLSSPAPFSRVLFILSFLFLLHAAGLSFSPHFPVLMASHGYFRRLFFHTCNEQNFQWILEAFPGDTIRAACRQGAGETIPADLESKICKGSFKTGSCPAESQVSYRTLFPTAPADFEFFESFDKAKATIHIPPNLQRPYPTLTFGWRGTPNATGETPTALVTVFIKDKDPDLPPGDNNNDPTNPDNPTNPTPNPSTPGGSGGKPSSTIGISPCLLSYAAVLLSSVLACSFFRG